VIKRIRWNVSKKKILTISKSLSQWLRSLDRDWEISILSRHHLPVPKVLIEVVKSVKTWNFSICQDFWVWSTSKSLNNFEKPWEILKSLDKSWKVSINLKNLDSLDLSRQSWWNSWHSLISILKILTKKKKSCLDSKNNLDKFQKLILTDQEFLISISIGLNCWDPHA